jgi:hypothetical protein
MFAGRSGIARLSAPALNSDMTNILKALAGGRDRDRTCDPYHVKVGTTICNCLLEVEGNVKVSPK